MRKFIRGSSSYVRIELHVSMVVKYRHKVFDIVQFRTRCEALLRETAQRIGIQIIELGFDRDHLHMVILLAVTHRLDKVMKSMKGTSGRKLLHEFPEVKRRYFWKSGLWSGAIFGDSLGSEPEKLYAYVKNQGKKKYQTLEAFL